MKRVFKKNLKTFFIIFPGLSVARNCLRPETGPLTVLGIKKGLLNNFTKTLKGRNFIGQSATGLQFSITNVF